MLELSEPFAGKISLTNDWEEPVGCARSYRVNLTSSSSNKIR